MSYLKHIIKILFLGVPVLLFSQPEIDLPSELHIFVADSAFEPSESWTDSLILETQTGYLRYEIVNSYREFNKIQTKIRVPQIFSFSQVIRQIIFYYGLLNDENARSNEILLIYPFFKNIDDEPAARCSYISEGRYQIELNYWEHIDLPGPPPPENKFLYNRLLEASMSEFGDRDGISEEILEKIASENNIDPDQLLQIYQNVKLWQLAQ